MTIFPMIQPELSVTVERLPLAREIAWDFEKDLPVLKNGDPVMACPFSRELVMYP